jgi:hypothetical protein
MYVSASFTVTAIRTVTYRPNKKPVQLAAERVSLNAALAEFIERPQARVKSALEDEH